MMRWATLATAVAAELLDPCRLHLDLLGTDDVWTSVQHILYVVWGAESNEAKVPRLPSNRVLLHFYMRDKAESGKVCR